MQFRRMLPVVSVAVLLAAVASAQTGTAPGSQNPRMPYPYSRFDQLLRQRRSTLQTPSQKGEEVIYRPDIQQMKMMSPTSGWALADGTTIYWTDDNGAQWKDITPPKVTSGRFGWPAFESVFFLDRNNGWALAANYVNDGGDFGFFDLYSTSNGGESWAKTHVTASDPGQNDSPFTGDGWISFSDSQHGWMNMQIMSGSAFFFGELLSTSDGGETWNRVESSPGVGGQIRLITAEDGWFAGAPGDSMYSTHNGGKSFQKVNLAAPKALGPMDYPTYTLPVFEGNGHGYEAVTYAGLGESKGVAVLFATSDGGKTWKQDSVLTNLDGVSVGVSAISTVVDSEWIIPVVPKTGEPTLTVVLPGSREAAQLYTMVGGGGGGRNISFLSPSRGWLICNQGLLSTTDGGATWTEITPGKRPTGRFRVPASTSTPPVSSAPRVAPPAGAEATSQLSSYGISQHLGFDEQFVTTAANMQTWWISSSYFDVGIYANCTVSDCAGSHSHATDTKLTASWVATVSAQGWGLIPIWSGPQAPCACDGKGAYPNCNTFPHTFSSDPATAMAQGVSEADSAIASVQSLGLDGKAIYVDVENYSSHACGGAVQGYVSGWDEEMETKGGEAGVYGGIYDSSDFAASAPIPDDVWIARTDGRVTVWNLSHGLSTGLSDSMWPNRQRIHQYQGGPNGYGETWGGVRLFPIDVDIDDAAIDAGNGVKSYSFTATTDTYPSGSGNETWYTGISNIVNQSPKFPVGNIVGWYVPQSTGEYNGFTDIKNAPSTFDYPGIIETQPQGINDLGQIVGWVYNNNVGGVWQGFFYDPAKGFSLIAYPGAQGTYAYGINDAGWVVGVWQDSNSVSHCFLYKAGQFVSFDPQSGGGCEGINGQGEIVDGSAVYDVEAGNPGNPVNIIPLLYGSNAINDNGQVVSPGASGDNPECVVLYAGHVDDLPATCSLPLGINDEVQIVGTTANSGFTLTHQ